MIIELKRDDSGADVHWQAIKYASYLHRADETDIVGMLASYSKESEDDARGQLIEHLGADDLSGLNRSQRIVLASHRFAPEVTSAVLWLNEQAEKDLVTCVQLTPYEDAGRLFLQSNTIIPVPGTEPYRVQIGRRSLETSTSLDTLSRRIGPVLGSVKEAVESGLGQELAGYKGTQWGYWLVWPRNPPWSKWDLCYMVQLQELATVARERAFKMLMTRGDVEKLGAWGAEIGLLYRKRTLQRMSPDTRFRFNAIGERFAQVSVRSGKYEKIALQFGADVLDDAFTEQFAEKFMEFVEGTKSEVEVLLAEDAANS